LPTELIEVLTQYGSLGVCAGFFAWLHVKMQHRLDEMVDKFQGQIENMEQRGDDRIDELRDRYDKIIDRYNSERDTLLQGITNQMKDTAGTLKEVSERLDEVGEKVQTGLAEMRQHYAVIKAERDSDASRR
jgi:uncharacterized coiled-coil DUF342 family protein